MRSFSFLLLSFYLAAALCLPSVSSAQAQAFNPVSISFPSSGQVLQGNIEILGNTAIEGFQSYEVVFSYANNPTDTWFLIAQSDQPVANGLLAVWDTTSITDGNYTLRLVVYLGQGQQRTATIEGLRVRNYTPIETATPVVAATPPSIATPTETLPKPTLTPLTENPASLSRQDIVNSVGKGALLAVGLLACGLLYQLIRSLGKKA